jgi:hypothetical protein
MSLKDQMPFFSDPPSWYYRMMAVVFGLVAVWFSFLLGFLCIWGHEYWTVLIFGPTIFFASMVARGLWRKARMKENERFNQETTPDA